MNDDVLWPHDERHVIVSFSMELLCWVPPSFMAIGTPFLELSRHGRCLKTRARPRCPAPVLTALGGPGRCGQRPAAGAKGGAAPGVHQVAAAATVQCGKVEASTP